jgi:hypothetical protein
MQQSSLRVGKHPVPHSKIAGLAVNRKGQLDWSGLRDGSQAGAVDRSNAMWGKPCLMGLKLILEKIRPSQT